MQRDTSIKQRLTAAARENGVSVGAARALFEALVAGGGRMAQFSHPELGGMGQWSRGGMLMIGDMFNHQLKAKVARLCEELADTAATEPAENATRESSAGRNWWPEVLGMPFTTGAQNNARYAVFPDKRRLVISDGESLAIYDTGDHVISGAGQQQGGDRSLTFSSQHGNVDLASLKKVDDAKAPHTAPTSTAGPSSSHHDQILAKIERLRELHLKGILDAEEFRAKKAELLARL